MVWILTDVPLQTVRTLCWTAAASTALAVVYGLTPYVDADRHPSMGRPLSVAYGSLHSLAWALALAWLVFACTHGSAGYPFGRRLISWRANSSETHRKTDDTDQNGRHVLDFRIRRRPTFVVRVRTVESDQLRHLFGAHSVPEGLLLPRSKAQVPTMSPSVSTSTTPPLPLPFLIQYSSIVASRYYTSFEASHAFLGTLLACTGLAAVVSVVVAVPISNLQREFGRKPAPSSTVQEGIEGRETVL